MRPCDDQARPSVFRQRGSDCLISRIAVVPVDPLHVPPISLEPIFYIVGIGKLGVAFDTDVVVIVDVNKIVQPQMAGREAAS